MQAKLAQSLSGDKIDANVDTVTVTTPTHENTGIEPNSVILTKEEAEDSAIQTINDNAEQAQKLIDNQDDGVISKTYDKYKEATNSKLAKSHVQDVVDKQSQTAEFLQEAKDGKLTYKDYLERKRGFLYKSLPDIDSFNDKLKQSFKNSIKTLNPEQINALQYEISNLPKDKDKYKDAKLKFYGLFRDLSMTKQKLDVTSDFANVQETKYVQNKEFIPENGDKLMSFEEVFEQEQGVKFDKENIQKYNESVTKFALATKLTKAKENIDNAIYSALQRYETNSSTGLNSTTVVNKELATTIGATITQLYGKDNLAKGLAELTDGKYTLDDNIKSLDDLANHDLKAMPNIAKLIQAKINERCDKAMGGKSLDDYAKTMAEDYKNAYGYRDASALANAFTQDQEGVVQTARNGVQIVGTVVMVGGMAFCPPAALGGGLIASFGGIGVEALNESTKQNVSPEKMAELKKEFAQNVALFAVGAGAGKLGSSAKAMLTAKNAPKFVAMIGDIGVDSTVSLIGDLVLTGQLDITGEGFSQVMSLIAGHKGKIVKGVQHLKEKVNDKFRLRNENPNRNIMQMPNGTLVEVKPDGSTVEVKADEVHNNNHNSEQPTEWKKVNIGGEEIEVAMTRDASGNTNVDFSRARKLNADGKYEEFDATTQKPLLADEVSTDDNSPIVKKEQEVKNNDNATSGNTKKYIINDDGSLTLIDNVLADDNSSIVKKEQETKNNDNATSGNTKKYIINDDGSLTLINNVLPDNNSSITRKLNADDVTIQKTLLTDEVLTNNKNYENNRIIRDDVVYDFLAGKVDDKYVVAVLRDVDDLEQAFQVAAKNIKDKVKLAEVKNKILEKVNKNIADHGSIVLQSEIPESKFMVDSKSGIRYAVADQNDIFLIHAVPEGDEIKSLSYLIDVTNNRSDDAYLSLSLVNKNSAIFGDETKGLDSIVKYGIIPKNRSKNVTSAGFGQITNYRKDFSTFVEHQSYENLPEQYVYLKNSFLKNLKDKGYDLTDKDYIALFNELKNKEFLNEITDDIKIGDKILKADELKDALETSNVELSAKMMYGEGSNNEVSSIIDGIRAIYARVDNIDDVKPEIKQLAKDNGLDIVLLGKPTKLDIKSNPQYQSEMKNIEQAFKDGKIRMSQMIEQRKNLKTKYSAPQREKLRAKTTAEQKKTLI